MGAGAGPTAPEVVTATGAAGAWFKLRATDSGRGTAGNGTLNPGSDFTVALGDKPF